jgi:hypothetical protein
MRSHSNVTAMVSLTIRLEPSVLDVSQEWSRARARKRPRSQYAQDVLDGPRVSSTQ